jgi:hypothetical protein
MSRIHAPAAPPLRAAAAVALLLGALAALSCGGGRDEAAPPPDKPLLLFAVDGFEWSVLLPMLDRGELPTLARLMDEGVYGRLESMIPTWSPVIWTTVATGKSPEKHGIRHFVRNWDAGEDERALYTNSDRKTKALWNILSDYDRTVDVVGWWMTFPVEEVNGVMVAQANTREQMRTEGGRAVWKGTLIRGMSGQVWPPDRQREIMALADSAEARLSKLKRESFGFAEAPGGELARRLWNNTSWAFRADTIYMRVARALLESDGPPDLLMVYFGGPDVAGHRFWRYAYPASFDDPPTDEEREAYAGIIRDYYRYVDEGIGAVLEDAPPDATVLVLSDHGMHAVNLDQTFDPDLPPANVNSGDHQDAPDGMFVAAGSGIRRDGGLEKALAGGPSDLPSVGNVLDIAPTVLALKGVPVGSDMEGIILQNVLDRDFLKRHPPRYVPTHDSAEWLASRPDQIYSPAVERERIDQLKALGYLR